MNAIQAAEYRDSIARMRLATHAARLTEAREAGRAKPKRPRKMSYRPPPAPPLALPPPVAAAPVTREQAELAARLAPHICAESVIDRTEHALGVARMILNQPSA